MNFRKVKLPTLLAAGTILAVTTVAIIAQGTMPKIARAQTPVPPTTVTSTTVPPTAVPPTTVTPTTVPPTTTAGTPRTDIGVSGTGRVSVTPDTAIASIGVDITAPTLAGALDEASTKMTTVIDAIKAAGVADEDIQTTSYNVFPITNQPGEGETATVTGYRVSNLVTVKIREIDDVGAVMDAALEAGANSINSVYFTVDDPTQAQAEARTAAVQDAMAKAEALATAAGVNVGRIVSISELSGNVIPFRGAFDAFPAPQAGGGAGPVETGSTEITVNVEMHFEIAE